MPRPTSASPARSSRDRKLPEGPFGDHLGYYSLAHDFPVLRVEQVCHRPDAIWPFTVVGRPPQEDTMFGQLIHELTGPVDSERDSGRARRACGRRGRRASAAAGDRQRAVHAVRRAAPPAGIADHGQRHPGAGATVAGQVSVDRRARRRSGAGHARHRRRSSRTCCARVDWTRDLHFQTCTTIDTLDYSGDAINEGSKLVIAAVGPPRRELPTRARRRCDLPAGFGPARVCLPGVLAIGGPPYQAATAATDRRSSDSAAAIRARRSAATGFRWW